MFTRILRHAICRKAEAINGVMDVQRHAERCSYAASRVRLTFLGLFWVVRAEAAGLRTRQGRAARVEGRLLLVLV
jgi:hypothetical protein